MRTRVYFATSRAPMLREGVPFDFGIEYNKEQLDNLTFGWAEVEDGKMVQIHCPLGGSVEVFQEIKDKIKEQRRPVLINVHGYGTGFQDGIVGAAHTKVAYSAANPVVFLFSWPSNGRNLPADYKADRLDAWVSGVAMARAAMKFAKFMRGGDDCGQEIYLLTHSMGNYLLESAVQQAIEFQRGLPLPLVFDGIIMAAADVDADAFDDPKKLKRLPELTREVFVFISKHDRALWGSKATKGNPERLGRRGPANPAGLPNDVTVVDCGPVDKVFDLDFIGHGYYDERHQVVEVAVEILRGKEAHQIERLERIPSQNRFAVRA